jgi:hypothetical protein
MVADILRRVLLAFRDDRQAALAGLREAESSMLEFNRLADRRAEASKAWSRGDYAKVREIYSAMTGVLTPLEVKRLSIARRK